MVIRGLPSRAVSGAGRLESCAGVGYAPRSERAADFLAAADGELADLLMAWVFGPGGRVR